MKVYLKNAGSAILVLLSVLITGVSVAQRNVIIKGNVMGDTKGYNKVYLFGKSSTMDSAMIVNGKFEFNVPFDKPFASQFSLEYSNKVTMFYPIFVTLIDEPGTLYLKDIDLEKGIQTAKISGIKSAEDFVAYYQQQTAAMDEYNKSKAGSAQAQRPMMATRGGAKNPDPGYVAALANFMESFVKSHSDSYASVYVLDGTGRWEIETSDLVRIYGLLSPRMKASGAGKDIQDYLIGLESSKPGQLVKDFQLNTPDGKTIRFSNLEGKYVLIDFWASWCGPCKASFPHLKEVYQKYKGEQFEIYSISIDENKDAWLKESKVQDLPWLQTLDTKNISKTGFAITAVPTTYLIDPDGKIIMKDIGFDSNGSLEKKLDELLGKKRAATVPGMRM